MTLAVQNLTDLDQALVDQQTAIAEQLLQEYNPSASLQVGVIKDTLINPAGIFAAANQTNINLANESSSLSAIIANPTLADPGVVAACLSNYNIVAQAAVAATGQITVVLDSLVATTIPAGATFTLSGVVFSTLTLFSGRTTAGQVISSSDALITQISANRYGFTIGVTAVTPGSAGNVILGTAAIPGSPPAHFINAFAASTFSGGVDADTNQQLLNKLSSGMAAKAWSSRLGITGLLEQQFPSIENLSIIGFGDIEMLRDQHAIWPGSNGGRCDIYAQTAELYAVQALAVVASLVSKVGAVGTWQFAVGRDQLPGFYQPVKVLRATDLASDAGITSLTQTFGTDLTVDATHQFIPDIVSTLEGAYTRYQTVVIEFLDTQFDVTNLSPGATNPYTLIAQIMPQIDAMQDFLNQETTRPPAGDVLVIAAVPCFTTVAFTITVPASAGTVNVAALQQAVAAGVNTLGFVGTLSSSLISSLLHQALPAIMGVTNFVLAGQIRRRDTTVVALSDAVQLIIPDDPANGVTANTCVFQLSPANVAITVVTV